MLSLSKVGMFEFPAPGDGVDVVAADVDVVAVDVCEAEPLDAPCKKFLNK